MKVSTVVALIASLCVVGAWAEQDKNLQRDPFIEQARDIYEELLAVCRRDFGKEHPKTLMAMSYLAATLRELGDGAGARELYEELLAVSRRELGKEDPRTLMYEELLAARRKEPMDALTVMSYFAADLGNGAAAQELHEEALAICRMRGEEHPNTRQPMIFCHLLEKILQVDPGKPGSGTVEPPLDGGSP